MMSHGLIDCMSHARNYLVLFSGLWRITLTSRPANPIRQLFESSGKSPRLAQLQYVANCPHQRTPNHNYAVSAGADEVTE
jgi:hypothetical protein